MGRLIRDDRHIIEDGDPRVDEAFCSCHKFRVRDPQRNVRMAAAYRHLADVLDPVSAETA